MFTDMSHLDIDKGTLWQHGTKPEQDRQKKKTLHILKKNCGLLNITI